MTAVVTSATTTVAPCAASVRAMARPMPDAAPVTMQTWPAMRVDAIDEEADSDMGRRSGMRGARGSAMALAPGQEVLRRGGEVEARREAGVDAQARDVHRRAVVGRVVVDVGRLAFVRQAP